MGAGSKGGKLHYYSPGPRARRLFTYMAVLARGLAAYVGYVAPLDVAMSAIVLPIVHGHVALLAFISFVAELMLLYQLCLALSIHCHVALLALLLTSCWYGYICCVAEPAMLLYLLCC